MNKRIRKKRAKRNAARNRLVTAFMDWLFFEEPWVDRIFVKTVDFR